MNLADGWEISDTLGTGFWLWFKGRKDQQISDAFGIKLISQLKSRNTNSPTINLERQGLKNKILQQNFLAFCDDNWGCNLIRAAMTINLGKWKQKPYEELKTWKWLFFFAESNPIETSVFFGIQKAIPK